MHNYDTDALKDQVSKWNIRKLEIVLRLHYQQAEVRQKYEKLLSAMQYFRIESATLYLTISTCYMASTETYSAGLTYLRKAKNVGNESVFTTLMVYLKNQSIEESFKEVNESRVIAKKLQQVKRLEKRIIACTTLFWREMLKQQQQGTSSISNGGSTSLASYAEKIHDYTVESNFILSNLIIQYSKNTTVLRNYAHFLEAVKQDHEAAQLVLAEIEAIEEQRKESFLARANLSSNSAPAARGANRKKAMQLMKNSSATAATDTPKQRIAKAIRPTSNTGEVVAELNYSEHFGRAAIAASKENSEANGSTSNDSITAKPQDSSVAAPALQKNSVTKTAVQAFSSIVLPSVQAAPHSPQADKLSTSVTVPNRQKAQQQHRLTVLNQPTFNAAASSLQRYNSDLSVKHEIAEEEENEDGKYDDNEEDEDVNNHFGYDADENFDDDDEDDKKETDSTAKNTSMLQTVARANMSSSQQGTAASTHAESTSETASSSVLAFKTNVASKTKHEEQQIDEYPPFPLPSAPPALPFKTELQEHSTSGAAPAFFGAQIAAAVNALTVPAEAGASSDADDERGQEVVAADDEDGVAQEGQEDSRRQLIANADSTCCITMVIASISIVFSIYLFVLLMVSSLGVSNFQFEWFRKTCQQPSHALDFMLRIRHGDILQSIANSTINLEDSIQSNIAANELYFQELPSFASYRTLVRAEALTVNTYSLPFPILKLNNYSTISMVIANRTTTVYDYMQSWTYLMREISYKYHHGTPLNQIQEFWYLWLNYDLGSTAVFNYCRAFHNDIRYYQQADVITLAVTASSTFLFHALYLLIVFIPAMLILLNRKKHILGVMTSIPKDVMGLIYHNLNDKYSEIVNNIHVHGGKRTSANCLIILYILIILIVEATIVSLILADTITILVQKSGAYELTFEAEQLELKMNTVMIKVAEAVYPFTLNPQVNQNSQPVMNFSSPLYANWVSQIRVNLKDIVDHWSIVRFGSAVPNPAENEPAFSGMLGEYSQVDAFAYSTSCTTQTNASSANLFLASQFKLDSCQGINELLSRFIDLVDQMLTQAPTLSEQERIAVMAYIFKVAEFLSEKLVSMIMLFSKLKSNSGLPIDLRVAFVVAILIIILITYPLYLAISSLHSINYQIRQMLMHVPHQVIDSLPRLKYYIESNKILISNSKRRHFLFGGAGSNRCLKLLCCSCQFLWSCFNSGGDVRESLSNSISIVCKSASGEYDAAMAGVQGTEANASSSSILESSNDSVIVCTVTSSKGGSANGDSGEGLLLIVMEVNHTLTEVFGYNAEDVIGLSLLKLVPEAEQKQFKATVKDVLATGKSIKLDNQQFMRKSGAPFPAFVSMGTCFYAGSNSGNGQQNEESQNRRKVVVLFVRDTSIERKQKELLRMEQERAEKLLLNILPKRIASRLKNGELEIAETNEDVTVLFTDMVGFTQMSKNITASKLVELLNAIVQQFDELATKFNLEKIKTIGDAYFCCGGLDQLHDKAKDTTHPERIIHCALAMIEAIKQFNLQIRAGCHTGPVVSGVIGRLKFQYDVYGDTVNTASRMESTGVPGLVQCSRETYARVFDLFDFEERSDVQVKGKGTLTTYLVQRVKTATKSKTQ